MIHHLVLFKLKPCVDDATLEWMMRETRSQLLKIPEVLSLKCGRSIDPEDPYQFFLSVDVESTSHLAAYAEDPVHVKFVQRVIRPHIDDRLALDFEMEPGKDLRYS